jgi:hypothetical protein
MRFSRSRPPIRSQLPPHSLRRISEHATSAAKWLLAPMKRPSSSGALVEAVFWRRGRCALASPLVGSGVAEPPALSCRSGRALRAVSTCVAGAGRGTTRCCGVWRLCAGFLGRPAASAELYSALQRRSMEGGESLTTLLRLSLERTRAVAAKGRLARRGCPRLPLMRPVGCAAPPYPRQHALGRISYFGNCRGSAERPRLEAGADAPDVHGEHGAAHPLPLARLLRRQALDVLAALGLIGELGEVPPAAAFAFGERRWPGQFTRRDRWLERSLLHSFSARLVLPSNAGAEDHDRDDANERDDANDDRVFAGNLPRICVAPLLAHVGTVLPCAGSRQTTWAAG